MDEKNNGQQKKMTLEDLAQMMNAGFEKSNKRTDEKIEELTKVMNAGFEKSEKMMDKKIEELATMINDGFNNANENVNERFKETNERLDGVDGRLYNIEAELIKKIDRTEYNTLSYRAEKLEKKFA